MPGLVPGIHVLGAIDVVLPGRCAASNPESRNSGFGPADRPGM